MHEEKTPHPPPNNIPIEKQTQTHVMSLNIGTRTKPINVCVHLHHRNTRADVCVLCYEITSSTCA